LARRLRTTPSEEDARPTRQRRPGGRSARVRAAVLDATLVVLAEEGDAFSIPHVAARAGVHETSIYRRWGSREALIADAVTSRVGTEIPVPDTGSLRGDLVALLKNSIRFLGSPLGTQLVRATATAPHLGATEIRHAYWPERFGRIAVVFTRAIARGEIADSADIALATEMLFGLPYLHILVTHAAMDDTLAERAADFVCRALATRAQE
jgi:AcrR family transcriptional regulator